MSKHKALSSVSVQSINEYLNKLEKELKDIKPKNLINYDKTNITDDPGKTSFIRLFKKLNIYYISATVSGVILPPYIVYKAKNLYPEWIEEGQD